MGLKRLRMGLHHIFFRRVVLGLVAAMPVLLTSWNHLDMTKDKYKAQYLDKEDTFDFVIVGGGTAGIVLANRLSENFKVLILEAGGEPHPFQRIPNFSFALLSRPQIDYNHKSVPQKYTAFGQPNQQVLLNQGKSLGGTSNINYLVYLRGHPKDFDYWSWMTNDPSWSYKELLQYFRKIENYKPGNNAKSDPSFHGKDGTLDIQLADWRGLEDVWIQGGRELGYENVDLNGGFDEGFDAIYYPIKNGKRAVLTQYLKKIVRRRLNLSIYKYSKAIKILFRGPEKEAYAVKYLRHGKKKIAFAKKEIIVSCGSILSPKLLMLSGIGPYEHLSQLMIPVISDRPVGQNLQDHVSTYIGPFTVKEGKSFNQDRDVTAAEFGKFALGKGALTTTLANAAAEIVSSYAKSEGEGDYPDIVMYIAPIGIHKDYPRDIARSFNIREDLSEKYYGPLRGKDAFTLLITNGRPRSYGQILLKDRNHQSAPLIDPNYLADPHDLKVMIEGVRIGLRLAENTTAFQSINTRYHSQPLPECEHFPFRSDAYFECHIRSLTISLHHLVGTCSMGPADSPAAVVDPELKVIGVKHLRVIDASIQPKVVVTNTMASTLMIAEKGADMIKKYWLRDEHEHIPPPPPHLLPQSSPIVTYVTTTLVDSPSPSYGVGGIAAEGWSKEYEGVKISPISLH